MRSDDSEGGDQGPSHSPSCLGDIREAESRSGCLILKGTLTSQESFDRSLIRKGEVSKRGGEQERSVRRRQRSRMWPQTAFRSEGGVSLAFQGLP